MLFKRWICPQTFQLYQIQNGRLVAIIVFNMSNIWKMVPDSYTITIEQNVQFQAGVCPDNIQLEQIQNGRLVVIIDFNMRNIWQTLPDS